MITLKITPIQPSKMSAEFVIWPKSLAFLPKDDNHMIAAADPETRELQPFIDAVAKAFPDWQAFRVTLDCVRND